MSNIKHAASRSALIATVLTTTATLHAETYYVDVTSIGGACADTNSGTQEISPWCTLGQATATVQAGDTVMIRGGTYSEVLWPESSGTESDRITFQAYPGEIPILTLPSDDGGYTIDIRSHSYLTFDGLHSQGARRYLLIRDSSHVWVRNCVFTNADNSHESGWYVGVQIEQNSQYNWLHDNVIGGVGYCTNEDNGGTINVGSWAHDDDYSHYNLIENNVLFHGGHHVMEMASSFNVVRNNTFHNEEWMTCAQPTGQCGNRDIGLSGNYLNVLWNVFENNIIAHSAVPADGNTASCFSLRANNTIVRRNVFHNCDGSGIEAASYTHNDTYEPDPSHSRIYHNTFFHNGHHAMTGVEDWKGTGVTIAHHGTGPEVTDVALKNNLFHDNRTDAITYYYVEETAQIAADNWEHAGDPEFIDDTGPADPADPSVYDFHLQATSPCIDIGGFVTTTSAAGQGTEIPVDDASYFSDGFGVVNGDRIQLEGETDRLQILDIDYDQNLITVDEEATWTDAQGVGLPYQGDAPDIGAYEYGEEGGGGVGPGGTGGTGNTGGIGGTGGTAGSTSSGATYDSGDDGGCGCRVGGRDRGAGRWGLLALAVVWASRRRRLGR